jgi:hypothetical protein
MKYLEVYPTQLDRETLLLAEIFKNKAPLSERVLRLQKMLANSMQVTVFETKGV